MSASEEPLFSIVTPSLRMLQWLKLCARSVADQNGVSFEHIVQDAGTGPDLDEWARTQPQVRCFQEPDRGMYDAVNKGLAKAKGRFLAYLNCDEQYLPGALERVAEFFARHPKVEVVFGDVVLVDADGNAKSYRRVVTPTLIHTRLAHLGAPTCGTFFRRSIVERGHLFDSRLRSIGDAVWIYGLLRAGVRMSTIKEPLAIYTFTGMNDSESENPARELQAWRAQNDSPPAWLRTPAILLHRLRKLAAGAYVQRRVQYAIYTMKSPNRRVDFELARTHFGWPGATAPMLDAQRQHPSALQRQGP